MATPLAAATGTRPKFTLEPLWQLAQAMERQGLSKTELAAKMHTSRAQLDRVLKAEGNVTLQTLQRAAALVGRELRVELR